jgi:hypothetical protein
VPHNLPARINGPFVPGQSGNAGRRPHAHKEFTELARSFAPDALRTLVLADPYKVLPWLSVQLQVLKPWTRCW